ncbi:MAG: sigma-70 family RNA polymerase sigma factor [Bacteroidales bacterium]|nr:sigma-70 family RNA polymerase sigma factor [Bacteroidales bacterium]
MARQLSPSIMAFCLRLCRAREEAEDLYQETMLKMWRHRDHLDEYKSLEALAKVIARNTAINQARSGGVVTVALDVAMEIPSHLPAPDQALIEADEEAETDALLRQLPEAQRTILELRHHQGLDNAEIAALLCCPEGRVRTTLSRARQRIRQLYLSCNTDH